MQRTVDRRAHPALIGRLQQRFGDARMAARSRRRPVLLSISVRASPSIDPPAAAVAARLRDEPWFSLDQPDRDGMSIAGVGCAVALHASGSDRFRTLSSRWQDVAARALSDELPDVPGAGLVAMAGFAFAPGGGSSREWRGFAPGALAVPELGIARHRERVWLTVNLMVAQDDIVEPVLDRIQRRLAGLEEARLPLFDPAPVGTYEVASSMAPAHYEQAVGRAVQRIRAGEFEKIVLARQVDVYAPRPYEPASLLGVLREAFSSSFVYAVGRGDATFIGATPELLIRRQGQRATTVALAGSTRRSADPAVDDHLGEQLLGSEKDRHENRIVARRIVRALRPHTLWVSAAEEAVVVKVANIQHLATPIRAQLATPLDALSLAGVLHPTPAVGAEPRSAIDQIPGLEGFDRGWYAGTLGWVDASGDGEFCVALRCALLRGDQARCYAGGGIVADSEPVAELAETEVKLQAMLPVLSG